MVRFSAEDDDDDYSASSGSPHSDPPKDQEEWCEDTSEEEERTSAVASTNPRRAWGSPWKGRLRPRGTVSTRPPYSAEEEEDHHSPERTPERERGHYKGDRRAVSGGRDGAARVEEGPRSSRSSLLSAVIPYYRGHRDAVDREEEENEEEEEKKAADRRGDDVWGHNDNYSRDDEDCGDFEGERLDGATMTEKASSYLGSVSFFRGSKGGVTAVRDEIGDGGGGLGRRGGAGGGSRCGSFYSSLSPPLEPSRSLSDGEEEADLRALSGYGLFASGRGTGRQSRPLNPGRPGVRTVRGVCLGGRGAGEFVPPYRAAVYDSGDPDDESLGSRPVGEEREGAEPERLLSISPSRPAAIILRRALLVILFAYVLGRLPPPPPSSEPSLAPKAPKPIPDTWSEYALQSGQDLALSLGGTSRFSLHLLNGVASNVYDDLTNLSDKAPPFLRLTASAVELLVGLLPKVVGKTTTAAWSGGSVCPILLRVSPDYGPYGAGAEALARAGSHSTTAEAFLSQEVVGQGDAVRVLSRALDAWDIAPPSMKGMAEGAGRPLIMALVGPSGVGKATAAAAMARLAFRHCPDGKANVDGGWGVGMLELHGADFSGHLTPLGVPVARLPDGVPHSSSSDNGLLRTVVDFLRGRPDGAGAVVVLRCAELVDPLALSELLGALSRAAHSPSSSRGGGGSVPTLSYRADLEERDGIGRTVTASVRNVLFLLTTDLGQEAIVQAVRKGTMGGLYRANLERAIRKEMDEGLDDYDGGAAAEIGNVSHLCFISQHSLLYIKFG